MPHYWFKLYIMLTFVKYSNQIVNIINLALSDWQFFNLWSYLSQVMVTARFHLARSRQMNDIVFKLYINQLFGQQWRSSTCVNKIVNITNLKTSQVLNSTDTSPSSFPSNCSSFPSNLGCLSEPFVWCT